MISLAWAQDAAGVAPGGDMTALLTNALPFILVVAMIYFVALRPQSQMAKKHAEMMKELKKGDVVVTDGGVVGQVVTMQEGFVQLRVGPGAVVTFSKEAIKAMLSGDVAKEATKLVAESKGK